MIKVGISAKTPDFARLVKWLSTHPDVDIVWLYNNGNTARVMNLYPELVGVYDGVFAPEPRFDNIDLYIGPYDARALAGDSLKGIFTELPADRAETGDVEIVPGVAELYRKELVRGARYASLPAQFTILGALALMPMAKNLMLNGVVNGAARLCDKDLRRSDSAAGRWLPADFITPLVDDVLVNLQSSFASPLRIVPFYTPDEVAMLTVSVETSMSLDDIAALYHKFYDDHRHVVILENPSFAVKASMVRATNRSVVSLVVEQGTLMVTVAFDASVKPASGGIMHLLNLLFGLDELTGF